jgi:hypothetical protein
MTRWYIPDGGPSPDRAAVVAWLMACLAGQEQPDDA